MPRSWDLQSRDLPMRLLIFVSISTSQTKKFYASYGAVAKQAVSLDRQLAKKDYLQINAFLASGGGVERNLEALQMKATASLGGGAIGRTLSSINESLGGSHRAEQWQEGWPTGRSKA